MNERQKKDVGTLTPLSQENDWSLSTGSDIESALAAAENLLDRSNRARQSSRYTGFVMLGTAGAAVAGLYVGINSLVTSYLDLQFLPISILMPPLALTLVASLVLAAALQSYGKHRRQKEAELLLNLSTQISAMVSEVLLDVARRERWSYMRQRTLELRLSAFPLHRQSTPDR